MLQNIRKKLQGTMAKVIVAIIVVPFALFGIESLLGGGGVQYVAEVNGEGISAVELQQEINQQKRRILASMGESVDPTMLDDGMLAGPALEFMIGKALLMQAANDYGLAVSDERLGRFIADMEPFQIDGRFEPTLYRQILSEQGYSPASFQQALREDLIVTQIRAGLAGSSFATSAEVDQLARLQEELRDVRYMVLPLDRFRDDAIPSEEEIQAWYEANLDRFTTPETVVLEYIEFEASDFIQPVEESELREAYEQERESFQVAEERRISHILFEQGADESDEALQERIAAARARLESEAFAAVAAEASDDIGSAGIGGDLGFTAGDTFPVEIEEAVAVLAIDQVSDPVQSDAGWHLLLVTDIRAGETADFASMRFELEQRIQAERASRDLIKTAEELRDLVFNADDLAGPAAELSLEVSRSEPVQRGQADGLFAHPRLNGAAFSAEVLDDRFNSEVIEIDTEHFVVLRVMEHKLPEAQALEVVRGDVESALKEELARERIRNSATEILAQLEQGASIEEVALSNDYEWQVELAARRDSLTLPGSLVQRLFELPAPSEGSTFEFVQNGEGDIEMFELVRVTEGDPARMPETERQRLQRQLGDSAGRQADNYYQQVLREKADIVRSS